MKITISTFAAALLSAFLILLAPMACAQSVDLSTLSDAQRAAVVQALAQPGNKAASGPAAEVQAQSKQLISQAREWAGLGQAVGSGVVAAAKELGVAANEFATTDLGRITVAVLLWKYLGAKVLGAVVGALLLIFGCGFGWYLVRNASIYKVEVESQSTPVLWGLFSITKVIKRQQERAQCLTNSQEIQQIFGYVTIVACFIIGLKSIF